MRDDVLTVVHKNTKALDRFQQLVVDASQQLDVSSRKDGCVQVGADATKYLPEVPGLVSDMSHGVGYAERVSGK
jgi:hypothetical protein